MNDAEESEDKPMVGEVRTQRLAGSCRATAHAGRQLRADQHSRSALRDDIVAGHRVIIGSRTVQALAGWVVLAAEWVAGSCWAKFGNEDALRC